VKSTVIEDDYFEFLFIFFIEMFQKGLEVGAVALRHFQQEVVAIDGRECTKQVSVIKAVLIIAKRLYTFYGKGFMRECQ
jgi:hypothetical protein